MTRTYLSLCAAITLTILGTAAAPGSAEAEPHSYMLICNGGGNMRATLGANATIQLAFSPGAAAGEPRAGECTWVDRGFRPGEPGVLAMRRDRHGAEYMLGGMLGGGRFFVHAYNDQTGHMIVTRVGP